MIVNMTSIGTPPEVTLMTSLDGIRWSAFDSDGGTTPVTLAKSGDYVYFCAGPSGNDRISSAVSYSAQPACRCFTIDGGRCSASGSVMSLLDAENSRNVSLAGKTAVFTCLFQDCVNLVSAPELPATDLATYCYQSMFQGCTNLVSAPVIPATNLAISCYHQMFHSCINLEEAPKLPADSLIAWCYHGMFYNCRNLRKVEVSFSDFISNGTGNWLYNVSESGVFIGKRDLLDNNPPRGASGIPDNWTFDYID